MRLKIAEHPKFLYSAHCSLQMGVKAPAALPPALVRLFKRSSKLGTIDCVAATGSFSRCFLINVGTTFQCMERHWHKSPRAWLCCGSLYFKPASFTKCVLFSGCHIFRGLLEAHASRICSKPRGSCLGCGRALQRRVNTVVGDERE